MAVPQGFLEHHAGTGEKSCIMGEEADILHVFATMHAEERRRLQEVDEKMMQNCSDTVPDTMNPSASCRWEGAVEKSFLSAVDKVAALAYTEGKFIMQCQEFIMSAVVFTQSFAGQWWWRIFSSGRGCGLDA